MQDATGDFLALDPTPDHGVVEGIDRELGGHPVADRVPHNPVGIEVLDRAAVDLALTGGAVLGDVGEPDPVWGIGGEDPLDVIVEDRRPGLLALPATPPLSSREDP